MTDQAWQTSSYCGGGACVEVILDAAVVYVRDTAGRMVSFEPRAWQAFIDTLKPQRANIRRCTCGADELVDECGRRGFACVGPTHTGGCRRPAGHDGGCDFRTVREPEPTRRTARTHGPQRPQRAPRRLEIGGRR